jgi:hypothetical protein
MVKKAAAKKSATKKPKASAATKRKPKSGAARSATRGKGTSKYDQPGAPWWKKLI